MEAASQQMSLPGGPFQDSAADQALDGLFSEADLNAMLSGDDVTSGFNTDDTPTPLDFSTADMAQFNPFPFNPAGPQEIVPMQTAMPAPAQPAYVPQYPAGPPGAHYHPAVGWFFPASAQPSPLTNIPMPFSSSVAPIHVPQYQAVPTLTVPHPAQKKTHASNFARQQLANKPRGPKRKQYFGPSAYFNDKQTADGESSAYESDANEESGRKRAKTGTSRPTRLQEANYTPGVDKHVAAAFYAARFRGGKWPSVAQICVCPSNTVKIPRPKNAFILFRMQKTLEYRRRTGARNHQVISKMAADEWNSAPKNVKEHFHHLADVEKQKHAEMFPGYKYAPKGNKQEEFGKSTCRCGAYQVNLARFEQSEGLGGDDEDAEGEEVDDYVPQTRQQNPLTAPVAQMTASNPFTGEMPNFGLPVAQQAEATAVWNAMQTKQKFPELPSPARSVRRSTRNKAQSVSYVEPLDNLEDDPVLWDILNPETATSTATPSASKPRPTPISTTQTNSFSELSLQTSTSRYNTRSKSISPSPGLNLPPLPEDTNLDLGEHPWDQTDFSNMVDFDQNDAETDSDNIVVAMHPHRPSSSGSSSSNGRTDPMRRTRGSHVTGM